jgi:hypothetical protein
LPSKTEVGDLGFLPGTANATLFLHTLFPDEWMSENTDFINKSFVFPRVSQESSEIY